VKISNFTQERDIVNFIQYGEDKKNKRFLDGLTVSNTGSGVCRAEVPGLAWTYDMRRMCVLVGQAWTFQEPVLLVGETGCGKTTAVQVSK
jgi:midasin (ATPase involved in ribosome maturation)